MKSGKENVPKDMRDYIDKNIHLSSSQIQTASRKWGSLPISKRNNVLKTLRLNTIWARKPLSEFPHYSRMLVSDSMLM